MKVVDRTVAPPLRGIEKIDLLKVNHFQLSNGMPVWCINAGTQDVIKIELLFNAGRWQEQNRAVAATTAKMLMEGTQKKSAQQIAEEVEFYGATINSDAAIDYSSVSIFTLNKHLHSLLPLLHEVIYEASFPEKELVTHVQNSKQRLLVNLEKVDFLAHKEFNERLYGKHHPNGYTTSVEDYDQINVSALRAFHKAAYQQGSFRIFMSGKIPDSVLKDIDNYFGNKISSYPNGSSRQHATNIDAEKKFFVEKKDAVQSAIRIGKIMINKTHPDFPKLRVLNTVLGGYFGSRLMQNLREDKGYCYGVHSGMGSYLNSGIFYITTEVGKEVTDAAVNEIYSEIQRLRAEPVPQEELQIVKNYMLGVMLADADGPFNVSEIIRGLIVFGLNESHFEEMVNATRSVTSSELQQLAQAYLDPESMIEVIAGSK